MTRYRDGVQGQHENFGPDLANYKPEIFLRNSLQNFYQFESQVDSAVPINKMPDPVDTELLNITKKYSN